MNERQSWFRGLRERAYAEHRDGIAQLEAEFDCGLETLRARLAQRLDEIAAREDDSD